MTSDPTSPDIEAFWEYDNPEASEQRFRTALAGADQPRRLELLTQIARSYGLRKRYAEAHALLDEVEQQLATAGARASTRYLLERGRVSNSSGASERARPLFVQAWEQARAAQLEGLAVDAAHMVAITLGGTTEAVPWSERGLTLARSSSDPKAIALIPALLNNWAWDLHELGRAAEALPLFEQAYSEWLSRGKQPQTQAAVWAIAYCLRSLGRYQEALGMLRELEAQQQVAGIADAAVADEIAANLAALGESGSADQP